MKLVVATSQFPVSSRLQRNHDFVVRHMRQAHERGARVLHFPECAMSGYAGVDLDSHEHTDWAELKERTLAVMARAMQLGLWVVLGSAHRLSAGHKPHNSLYIINDRGELVDRYDKRFCAGDASGTTGDLAHYTPGDHTCAFVVDGLRCGVAICHEYRYPELLRDAVRRGVQLIFHSYHAANVPPHRLAAMEAQVGTDNQAASGGRTLPEITMPATMVAAAASSHVWLSCSNSSKKFSCWPAFFVRPDGVVVGKGRRHQSSIICSTVDTEAPLYDSTSAWRARALQDVFHSGELVEDPRSRERKRL